MQGEQVAPLWRILGKYGAEIDFAWRTFKRHNEAKGVAAVHCVIIVFHADGKGRETGDDRREGETLDIETTRLTSDVSSSCLPSRVSRPKTLYNPDGTFILTDHINGYLMPTSDVFLEGRSKPKCPEAPSLTMGNMPLDGGNLIIEAEDLPKFVKGAARSASAPYHAGATLADLYDPLTMPPDLVKAHAHLDALVDRAYFGRDEARPSLTDAERVAHLFKLYAEKVKEAK